MAKLTAEEKNQRQQDTAALLATMNKASGVKNTDKSMATGYFKKAGIDVKVDSKTGVVKIDGVSSDDYSKNRDFFGSGSSAKKKMDMQKKKEDRLEVKSTVNAAEIKRDRTKKQYEDYINSEEYRKKQAESVLEQQREMDKDESRVFAPTSDFSPPAPQDEMEARLRREKDRAEAAYNASEDRKTLEAGRAEVEAMSEEDLALLDAYVRNRDNRQDVFVNDISWFLSNKKENDALKALTEKYGEDKALQLAEIYGMDLHEKNAADAASQGREGVNDGWISATAHNLLGIPARAMGNISGFMGRMSAEANRTGQFHGLPVYTAGDELSAYGGAVTEQTAQNIEGDVYDEEGNLIKDGGALRKLFSWGYQGAMSVADSTARLAMSGGNSSIASAVAGMGTFNQSMKKYIAQGASPEQAYAAATISAGIEYITSKLPMDKALKLLRSGGDAGVVKNVLTQAFLVEPSSEELNLFANMAMEAKVLGEKSGKEQRIGDLIAGGLTRDQAEQQFWKGTWMEALETYAVSAFGGLFGAGGAAYAGNQMQAVQEQQTTTQQSEQQNLTDIYTEMFTQMRENNGKASNRMAESVMSDPAAMLELGIDPEGTKAEQRRRVKEEMEKLFQKQNPQTETTRDVPEAEPMQATETSEQATMQASTPTVDMQMGANDQSAEGGQIKGTGAAEQSFTGKPTYNAILSEDNAQPDRRSDVRPMELPETDINGGNVSATTANVYGSQNTPDDLASAMEEPVARGDFSYVRISNDAATQRAQQTIGESGSWESARDNFRMDVDRGLAGAELSARGALILNHAAEVYEQAKASGDPQAEATAKKEWLTILSDVQKLGTNTAQGLQALRIIRDLMPQDKIQFAQIAVQNMARDMKLGADIQIDQQLLTDYENATTDQQRDEIMEKIQQNVADQIPSTILDKWNALRYTNMLGNLKTNVRNVAGNVANTAVYRFKDATGAVLESIANKVSRGKTGRTKSLVVNKQLQKAMEPYYQQVKNAVSSGGKYGENNTAAGDFAQGVMDKRQIFKFKPLESYRKATNWMMNNEYFGDEAFGKAAFTHAMAGYLQANGVKDIQNASPELLDRAMVYAVKEAQETTFHDNSALANVLGKLKKDTGIVGEGLIPFTKTTANVLTRAEEYSPIGIINTAVTAVKAANPNSDVTGTDVINSLSKTLTGSAIFALGAILKSNGILNGGPDEDDDQAAFDRMNGIQPYSINLPDGTTYTLDWLTPVAMPLFMGAQLMDIANDKNLTFADLEQVFTSIADPMIQMSMMQGINSSLESIKYSDNNMGQFFINAAVNFLSQGLTNTLLGQLERSTEEYRMTTYIDKDSQVPQWIQKQLGKASQKIPGWDYQQTEYIDARGEKQKNEGGLFYELLSPGYSQKVRDDAVTREMNRLRESTGENVFPDTASRTITYTDKQGTVHKDHNLTAEQYQTYAQTQGQTAQKLWEDVVNATDFDALTDAQKAKVSSAIESYARETAEIEAIGKEHTGYSDGWMLDVGKGGAMEIIQRTIASSLSSAKDNLNNAWKNGYDEETFIQEMENAFQTFQNTSRNTQRQVYDESSSSIKKYIDARKQGISNEKYASTAKALSKVGDTIIEKSSAIIKQPGLSNSEKTFLVKQNVSDAQNENIDLLLRMGYGITDYVDLYDDYKNYTKGSGKKNRTINKWMKDYGISHGAAKKLYEVFP